MRQLLESVGGHALAIKASRVDLCVDVLIPEGLWSMELLDQVVSRAVDKRPHLKHDQFTGVSIGGGSIMARLYDKPLEIRQKSHKDWMYEIWGIPSVPEGHKVIRVEFQHRRESLTSLGINSVGDLFQLIQNVWAYDTQKWLKLQDGTGPHHTQRTTLPWWKVVQDGFGHSLQSHPAVKAKAIRADAARLARRALGDLASLLAVKHQHRSLEDKSTFSLSQELHNLAKYAQKNGLDDQWLTERVNHKSAAYRRGRDKFERDSEAREQAGVASTQPIDWWNEL